MNENAEKNFPFMIEGESFNSPEEKLTAKNIIERAKEKGIQSTQGEIENLTLKSSKGNIYTGDDWVDLSQDNDFSLGVKIYRFTVNGQELESNLEKLVALDIIKMAQEKGVATPGNPENLLLEASGGEPKFNSNDWVDLNQFRELLLIPGGATPVA